jgi:hypothetical protein
MLRTKWEILKIEQPTADTLSPVISVEAKNFDWSIYGLKSNLPADCEIEFSVPSLPRKVYQNASTPLYALRQPEQPPIKKITHGWKRWHSAIKVPAGHIFQLKLTLPIEDVMFPHNGFISLYYEYFK